MKSTVCRSAPLVAVAAVVLLLGLWSVPPSQASTDTADFDSQPAFDVFNHAETAHADAQHERQRGQARASSSSSSRSSARSSSSSSRSRSSARSSSSSSRSRSSARSSSSSTRSSSGSRSSARGSSSPRVPRASSPRGSGSTRSSSSPRSTRTTRGTTTRGTTTRGTSRNSGSDSTRGTRTTTRRDPGTNRGTRERVDSRTPTRDGVTTRGNRDLPGYDRTGRTRMDTPSYRGGGGGGDYRPLLENANDPRNDNQQAYRTNRYGSGQSYVYDYPHRSYYCPYDFWYWNFGIGPVGWNWAWNYGYDWPYYGWRYGWGGGWPHYYGNSSTVFWSANVGWGVHANVAFPIYTPYYRYHHERADLGGIDLNVNPQDAGVYLNGQYIGVVDEFNGWPGYLWLEEGIYHLVVYKDGYETLSREYTIQQGVVLNVKEHMTTGVATHPDEVPVPPRVRYEIEADQQAEEDRVAARDQSEDEWRRRAAEYLSRRDADKAAPQHDGRRGPNARRGQDARRVDGLLDARVAPARLTIDAVPADASVYLNGTFLGSAAELSTRGGILVDPGDHVLELVRPGYDSQQRSFTVDTGDQLQLNLELQRASEEGVAVSSLLP